MGDIYGFVVQLNMNVGAGAVEVEDITILGTVEESDNRPLALPVVKGADE